METPSFTAAIATVGELFSQSEELALSGFLAGCSGLTREAYALDLRQYANGLRVSEAIGANIEQLGLERGHRTLTILRKAARPSPSRSRRVPPASSISRLANAARARSSPHVEATGWTAKAAARVVRRAARRSGITKRVSPHTLRHAFITAALDAGVPLRDVQEAASHADPITTMRYDRARVSLDRHATYIVATFIAGAAR
jgi:integrase/recombinase XerD